MCLDSSWCLIQAGQLRTAHLPDLHPCPVVVPVLPQGLQLLRRNVFQPARAQGQEVAAVRASAVVTARAVGGAIEGHAADLEKEGVLCHATMPCWRWIFSGWVKPINRTLTARRGRPGAMDVDVNHSARL